MCHYLYPVSIIHKDNDYELISGSVLSQAADSWRVQFSYITSTHFIHLESVLKTTKTSAGSQYFNLFFRHWNVTQKLENEIIKTFTLAGCSIIWTWEKTVSDNSEDYLAGEDSRGVCVSVWHYRWWISALAPIIKFRDLVKSRNDQFSLW